MISRGAAWGRRHVVLATMLVVCVGMGSLVIGHRVVAQPGAGGKAVGIALSDTLATLSSEDLHRELDDVKELGASW